jgi:hypothetical protein
MEGKSNSICFPHFLSVLFLHLIISNVNPSSGTTAVAPGNITPHFFLSYFFLSISQCLLPTFPSVSLLHVYVFPPFVSFVHLFKLVMFQLVSLQSEGDKTKFGRTLHHAITRQVKSINLMGERKQTEIKIKQR